MFVAVVFAAAGCVALWTSWRATPTFGELFDPRHGGGGLIGVGAIVLGALVMVGGSEVGEAERGWRIGLTLLFSGAVAGTAWWLGHPPSWPPDGLLIASALLAVLGIAGLYTPRATAWFRNPRAAIPTVPAADPAAPLAAR